MTGAHSRRKGRRFELELVHRFREVMPGEQIRRGLQYRGGEEVADVDMPCFSVEAKHHQRTNVRAAMRQAQRNCPAGRWPIAVTKDDQEPALATMQLDDFLELVQEWWARRPQ